MIMATKKTGAKRKAAAKLAPVPFAYRLVLHQWLLSLFGVARFEDLAEHLRSESLEGLDENNIHHFHHALTAHLFNLTKLPTELLLEYDQNIVRHTLQFNDRRISSGEEPIVWKYFQYLSLLFTEVYLDRYFRDPAALLNDLNEHITRFNTDQPEASQISLLDPTADAATQLNKVALWNATGSGKTLLMHVNILQYQHCVRHHGRSQDLNRILLLTPNEGLSRQHLREFERAGMAAELFSKDGRGLFSGQAVEILDIHKLKEEMGDKTVAVDAFESNNLVLIDEGHRGVASGEEGAWMRFRSALCEKGFSFEYSATFGQAVKNSKNLADLYAKSILFDYSYRYFYQDGFGKDYQILNLDEGTQTQHRNVYLVACLLAFYQQLRLLREERASFEPFNIEKPLWIFVGGSVTKGFNTREASDIVEILRFLSRYVANHGESLQAIDRVLRNGLITSEGKKLFAGQFKYLNASGLSAEQLFEDSLSLLFNATGGGSLSVENLKSATGEIALRVGDNEPFGVINVGDDAKLVMLCEKEGIAVRDSEFGGSLFHGIDQRDSKVNVLIGSRKFTEGWSSWRVSTMGLMNVGQSEGSQIIQLFGRGVRLKGNKMSLKRSSALQLPVELKRPKHIAVLETLSIFGIRANYMEQFRAFLEEEGLPSNDDRTEFLLPVIKNLGTQKLKTIRLKKTINGVSTEFGDAFRKLAPIPTLGLPTPYLQQNQVSLNWYPKIRALKSRGVSEDTEATRHHAHLTPRHVAFLDIDKIYFELERFKAERGWFNLNLTRQAVVDLLANQTWYTLQIPPEELAYDSMDKVRLWEEIATALLKKYTERYYTYRKREWELPHLEYREFESNDPNFPGVQDDSGESYYQILVRKSEEDIIRRLNELKALIEKREFKPWEFKGIKALWFGQHMYEPLLYLDQAVVEISPVPLNKGEKHFIEDLKTFHNANAAFFKSNELYLIRNLSKGRGVGFFEAGNFHPDFILWLVRDGKQRVIFVDPKGIRNLGATDPKIQFYKTVKDIEQRLGDASVSLDSFIISNTPSHEMERQWSMDKQEMLKRHVLFQEEDQPTYVGSMLTPHHGVN
jgi:hypothetical protein